MTAPRLGLLSTAVASLALVACGSSNKNGGLYGGPDDALRAKACYLGLAEPGTTYSGYSCSGSSRDSTVSGIGPKSWDDVRMTVDLSLNAPPAIGGLDVEGLTVSIPDAAGGDAVWNASLGSCTAKAVASAVDTDMDWIYYRIDIACTSPATPATGNPGAPLEMGQFPIVTFFTK